MYLGISIENIITVGVILLIWMLALHVAGQFGVRIKSWLPGGS